MAAGTATFRVVNLVDVSVVIPVRNGSPFIGKQLEAILAQESDARFEIVVADNGSIDDTVSIVQRYLEQDSRVRVVDASRAAGANVARNVGIAITDGRVVLLTDADDVVQPGWIQAYWRAFQAGAQTAGGGLNKVLADGTVLARDRTLYRSRVGNCDFANATNCGFTREVFEKVGGFDETLIGTADEVEFFLRTCRAGYQMALVPDAVVDKLQHTDLSAAFLQHFNFGRGETLLAAKYQPRLIAPGLLLVAVQTAVCGLFWATVGRIPRWRRHSVALFAFNLGMLVEGVRTLCE
jgi:glycosyltransferase involved in cell wall biosynthesis